MWLNEWHMYERIPSLENLARRVILPYCVTQHSLSLLLSTHDACETKPNMGFPIDFSSHEQLCCELINLMSFTSLTCAVLLLTSAISDLELDTSRLLNQSFFLFSLQVQRNRGDTLWSVQIRHEAFFCRSKWTVVVLCQGCASCDCSRKMRGRDRNTKFSGNVELFFAIKTLKDCIEAFDERTVFITRHYSTTVPVTAQRGRGGTGHHQYLERRSRLGGPHQPSVTSSPDHRLQVLLRRLRQWTEVLLGFVVSLTTFCVGALGTWDPTICCPLKSLTIHRRTWTGRLCSTSDAIFGWSTAVQEHPRLDFRWPTLVKILFKCLCSWGFPVTILDFCDFLLLCLLFFIVFLLVSCLYLPL